MGSLTLCDPSWVAFGRLTELRLHLWTVGTNTKGPILSESGVVNTKISQSVLGMLLAADTSVPVLSLANKIMEKRNKNCL